MARNQLGTEYKGIGYYDEDRSKFVDIHNSIKISIESFLATILFKGDLSRIVYCKEDIAFRRRIELVDAANKDTTAIQPVSLQLPFAWPQTLPQMRPRFRNFQHRKRNPQTARITRATTHQRPALSARPGKNVSLK